MNIADKTPTVVVTEISSPGGGSCTQYRYKSDHTTYLTCRTWDGASEGGADVYIAKPAWLRASPFTGAVIYPPYTTNDLIYAMDVNATGVTGGDAAECELIQVAETRAWADVHHFTDRDTCAAKKRTTVGSAVTADT